MSIVRGPLRTVRVRPSSRSTRPMRVNNCIGNSAVSASTTWFRNHA